MRTGAWTRYPVTSPGRRGVILWAPAQSSEWRVDAVVVWIDGRVDLELIRQTRTHRDYARGGWATVSLSEVKGWSTVWPQQNADLARLVELSADPVRATILAVAAPAPAETATVELLDDPTARLRSRVEQLRARLARIDSGTVFAGDVADDLAKILAAE
jgi:hypothetical protein